MAERNAAYRHPGWPRLSRAAIARDRGLCHWCGGPGADTADHLIPVSIAGPGLPALEDVAAAHRGCNSQRARLLEQEGVAPRAGSAGRPGSGAWLVTGPPGRRQWWGALQPGDLVRRPE